MPEQSLRLAVQGMSCQACATRIEKVLGKQPAIISAGVNFAGEEAQVRFDTTQTDEAQIIDWIAKAGFAAHPLRDSDTPPHAPPAMPWQLRILLLIAALFLPGMAAMLLGSHRLMPPVWLQCALATLVQGYFALPFYQSAIASVRGRLANMDVLVSIGTLAIYGYSVLMFWRHGSHAPVYFEAGIMVIALVSLGKYLEKRTTRHSLNTLHLLMRITPADVQRADGATVPLSAVRPGDLLHARHGDRIAADGVLTDGEIWCDESHLTGESRPVTHRIGDRVLAGALVGGGSGIYRADALGSATLLGDMMKALGEAQGSKAPIARLADRVAAIFVPVVLSIALATFLLTRMIQGDTAQALHHAVAVLVIACPCALGLATPAAVMAGLGQAVRHGIWFKSAAQLEAAGHIDTVVLDKTGTLTQGKPAVQALWTPDGNEALLCALAASAERHSSHPLSAAITATAPDSRLPVSHLQSDVGQGITARIDGHGTLRLGKPEYAGIRLPDDLPDLWQHAGIVAASLDGKPLGAFALADPLHDDSPAAIARLHNMGITTHIASGDRPSVVTYTARHLGITHAHSHLSPREKAALVHTLQARGQRVAMAGDGINDAPALSAADLGLAMKHGSDIAANSAGATLMRSTPMQIATALAIARATLSTIRQNLFFAFVYNIIAIPFAAFGYLSPTLAAVAMALSSLCVVGNALRLKRKTLA